MLEQADRARKMAEQELSDTNETLADLTVQNQSLSSSKRKLEQDLADLRHEADEALNEARQMVSTTDFTEFMENFHVNVVYDFMEKSRRKIFSVKSISRKNFVKLFSRKKHGIFLRRKKPEEQCWMQQN